MTERLRRYLYSKVYQIYNHKLLLKLFSFNTYGGGDMNANS